MEEIPKEAWIIIYIVDEPEDWIGCFPSNLHQMMVVDDYGKLPRLFDRFDEAEQFAKDKCLIEHIIVPIAGAQAIRFERDNRQLTIPDVSVSVCVNCDQEKETHSICSECLTKIINENKQTEL